MLDKFSHLFQKAEFGRKNQQAFLEDLSSLVKDGVPASQAIRLIEETTQGVTKDVAHAIAQGLAEGQPLAFGMKEWFSPATAEIIRAGESSGTLAEAMESAAQALAQQTGAMGDFINSALYPLVVFTASIIMLIFVKSSVLANFTSFKPVSQWPNVGQTLYYLGNFLQEWWWLVLVFIGAFAFALYELLQQLIGPSRMWVDAIPLLNLYREMTAARFMETLGLLLKNGVALNKSLHIMHQDAQPYLAWHLWMMEIRLADGKENVADVLDTGLIHHDDLMRLKVVALGKGFEHALCSLGHKANTKAAGKVIRAGKIVGALFLITGAVTAATVVFGIYSIGSMIAT